MKSFLSLISVLVLVAADFAATPGDAAGISGVTLIFGVIWVLLVAFAAGFVIFVNELIASRNLVESVGKALSCMFLIAIPTPVLGVIVAGVVGYQKLSK